MGVKTAEVLFRPHRNGAHKPRPRARTVGYERRRALPPLLAIVDSELAQDDPEAARRIISRLARALRAERQRGRAGHWSYDLNRHIALAQAFDAERRRLKSLQRAPCPCRPGASRVSGCDKSPMQCASP